MRKLVAEIIPKLATGHPEIIIEKDVKYGNNPEIDVDGKKLKTKYDKFDVLVADFAKKLGLTLN